MFHPVYKCDDYDFNDGVLIIYNAELVAQIKNITDWETISSHVGMYDTMICPNMFTDKDGNKANIVIFKQL
jgi:hypothetical protein